MELVLFYKICHESVYLLYFCFKLCWLMTGLQIFSHLNKSVRSYCDFKRCLYLVKIRFANDNRHLIALGVFSLVLSLCKVYDLKLVMMFGCD